jgi:hypothetical protein
MKLGTMYRNLLQVSLEVTDPFPLDTEHIHSSLCLKLSNAIVERYKGDIREETLVYGKRRYVLKLWVGGISDLSKSLYPPIFAASLIGEEIHPPLSVWEEGEPHTTHPKKVHDINEVNNVLGGIWGVLVKSGFDWATRRGILSKVKEELNVNGEKQ